MKWKYAILYKGCENMQKKLMISLILLTFILSICGAFYVGTQYKPKRSIYIYGTYVNDFNTISLKENNTYEYSYPVTSGDIKKLDDSLYFISSGSLKDHLLFLQNDQLKIININNQSSSMVFTKLYNIAIDAGE